MKFDPELFKKALELLKSNPGEFQKILTDLKNNPKEWEKLIEYLKDNKKELIESLKDPNISKHLNDLENILNTNEISLWFQNEDIFLTILLLLSFSIPTYASSEEVFYISAVLGITLVAVIAAKAFGLKGGLSIVMGWLIGLIGSDVVEIIDPFFMSHLVAVSLLLKVFTVLVTLYVYRLLQNDELIKQKLEKKIKEFDKENDEADVD